MNRDYALDYLKFFATFLIINSHLGKCYGEYSSLATGGAIGNGLFFFVSGFALSLGRVDRFDNWLKRRFFRLYPSVISKDILAGMVLGVTLNPVRQLVTGGGWFLKAILIFYLVSYMLLYLNKRYKKISLLYPLMVCGVFIIALFYILPNEMTENLYGSDFYYAWGVYFFAMLMGLYLGKTYKEKEQSGERAVINFAGVVLSIIIYYGLLALSQRMQLRELSLLSIIPFCCLFVFLYKLCKADWFERFRLSRAGVVVAFVSALCWESYLTQLFHFFTYDNEFDRYIPFPLNILATFVAIIATAYLIKILSNLIVQLFSKDNFNWKAIYKTW